MDRTFGLDGLGDRREQLGLGRGEEVIVCVTLLPSVRRMVSVFVGFESPSVALTYGLAGFGGRGVQ